MVTFLPSQQVFLAGAAGTGKTTSALNYLRQMLVVGIRPHSILLLVPQRTLGRVYQVAMTETDWPDAAGVDVVTVGGIARRSIELFWPVIAQSAGFSNYEGQEPTFLTIETAQYHMARFVDQMVQTGRFDSVSIPRARLIAQSLDNLSKAAINGFTIQEVTERLIGSWNGHSSRPLVYQAWQDMAQGFRQYCYDNNLLDFSLQIEIFHNHILSNKQASTYLKGKYQHLIADNVEENNPVGLDFIRWLWPSLSSALLIYDSDAGYRIFLGAEPDEADTLRKLCTIVETTSASYVQSPELEVLEKAIIHAFEPTPEIPVENPNAAFHHQFHHFYPQMVEWVCASTIDLVRTQHVEPREIVLIAPFLNDSLRFSVMNRLENEGIPIVSHRPSRAIREEPSARAMLTLMQLINPIETQLPPSADVVDMLVQLISDLDPIRARLLVDIVYGVGRKELGSFDVINAKMQQRITYVCGENYERLRGWGLEQQANISQTPPDYFLRSLFGDIASQPGFGFQTNLDAGTVAAQLIDSAYSFRRSLYPNGVDDWAPVWKEYRELVSEGLLAAFHPLSWQQESKNAVFIAPAYTYLMRNRPVDYQIWIDVGSQAWAERLEQPLTHPYVLRRNYPHQQVWTDEDEQTSNWQTLYKLVLGLVRRCRKQIYLGIADLGEQGFEQRGPLLYLFQQILQDQP